MSALTKPYILFLIGLALGIASILFYESMNKKNGAEPSNTEFILLQRIDSLEASRSKSDTIIKEIVKTKVKIKTEYETDTIYINSLPFDSLKVLFLREYPR